MRVSHTRVSNLGLVASASAGSSIPVWTRLPPARARASSVDEFDTLVEVTCVRRGPVLWRVGSRRRRGDDAVGRILVALPTTRPSVPTAVGRERTGASLGGPVLRRQGHSRRWASSSVLVGGFVLAAMGRAKLLPSVFPRGRWRMRICAHAIRLGTTVRPVWPALILGPSVARRIVRRNARNRSRCAGLNFLPW